MLDTVAFVQTRAGVPALATINALADTHVTVLNSGAAMGVPTPCTKIAATLFVSNTATSGKVNGVQIRTPSLGQMASLDFANYVANSAGSEIPGDEPPMDLFFDNPIPLLGGEALSVYTTNTGTNNESDDCVVFLTDGLFGVPLTLNALGQYVDSNGNVLRVQPILFNWSQTLTAHAWTAATLNPSQQLAQGTYICIGAEVSSATGIAARFIFQNSTSTNRPGVPCVASLANTVDPALAKFRMGRLGLFGTFSYQSIPQMEILASAADTSGQALLDLVKIA